MPPYCVGDTYALTGHIGFKTTSLGINKKLRGTIRIRAPSFWMETHCAMYLFSLWKTAEKDQAEYLSN